MVNLARLNIFKQTLENKWLAAAFKMVIQELAFKSKNKHETAWLKLLSITVKKSSSNNLLQKELYYCCMPAKHKLTWILRIKWPSINMRLSRELGSHRGSSSISTRRCRRSGRVVPRNLPGHCAILRPRSWARGCWKALVKGNQQSIINTRSSRTKGQDGGSYYLIKPTAQNKRKRKMKIKLALLPSV